MPTFQFTVSQINYLIFCMCKQLWASCSFRVFGEPAPAVEAKFFRERNGRIGKFASESRNLSLEQNRNRDWNEFRVDRRQWRHRRAGRGTSYRTWRGSNGVSSDRWRPPDSWRGRRRRLQRGQGQQRHQQLFIYSLLKLSYQQQRQHFLQGKLSHDCTQKKIQLMMF